LHLPEEIGFLFQYKTIGPFRKFKNHPDAYLGQYLSIHINHHSSIHLVTQFFLYLAGKFVNNIKQSDDFNQKIFLKRIHLFERLGDYDVY
jgi:hypothetical protein